MIYYSSLKSMDMCFGSKHKHKVNIVKVAKTVFIMILLTALTFTIGFLTGYFSHVIGSPQLPADNIIISLPNNGSSVFQDEKEVPDYLMDEISSTNIDNHLKILASRPHLSGTPGNQETVTYIHNFWKQIQLDRVKLIPYKILLSNPTPDAPNVVSVHNRDGDYLFKSEPSEPILRPEDNSSEIVPPFNAYSPPGDVQGELIYINYGRVSDFEYIKKRNITIKGHLCIVRYGFNFRADKVSLGEKYGCAGMIIFTDPIDYGINITSKVYPDSWLIPGGGVQRGTIKKSSTGLGDPLTPLYPSTDHAYRLDTSEADLPKIPCQPIGYDDARKLLSYLGGEEVPTEWRGGLNITYRFGPQLINEAKAVRIVVNNKYKIDTIHNIIGFIEGAVEPDRYVMMGNHYDAWVYGGADPNSATAILLEMSRAFMSLVNNKGWRPRRTLVFCSWGAEEQGVIGSREFVEEFGLMLSQRAVAYLNVDTAVHGRYVFRGRALPMLNTALFEATRMVPNPDEEEVRQGRKYVYDTWCHRNPEKSPPSLSPPSPSSSSSSSSLSSSNQSVIADTEDKTNSNYMMKFIEDNADHGDVKPRPRIGLIGSGSDFAPFVGSIGVTSADFRFIYDEKLNISTYPLYHTGYETYYLFSKFHDPAFLYSKALGQVWAQLARILADRVQIPLDPVEYSNFIKFYIKKLKTDNEQYLQQFNITLDALSSAVDNFIKSVHDFNERFHKIDLTNVYLVRQYNDQLMQLERSFIDPVGLPDRPAVKHVIFAPSRHNSYAAAIFPGVVDAIFDLKQHAHEYDRFKYVEVVKKQISILTFMFERADASLKPPCDFVR